MILITMFYAKQVAQCLNALFFSLCILLVVKMMDKKVTTVTGKNHFYRKRTDTFKET